MERYNFKHFWNFRKDIGLDCALKFLDKECLIASV
jgi:hypothetical protein